jgi:predicted ribosome quality control (RQC) complex YloA/Tae2 family protein
VHSSSRRHDAPKAASPTPPPASTSLFHTLQTPSGRSVLVGKSARGNDYLLKRKAVNEDLWLHVSRMPGAHVLLRTAGEEPSPDDIAFCAKLAVAYSKAKGKGKTEVIVARVKDVERPKGALPGQVRVKRLRTILSEG